MPTGVYTRTKSKFPWLVKAVREQDSDECILWPGAKDKDGYGKVRTPFGKEMRVHRVTYWIAFGSWPLICRHSCNQTLCFNKRHLSNGTHADNVADRVRCERSNRGIGRPLAKLTDEIVRQIRLEYISGQGNELAEKFGVSQTCILLVVKRRTWKHVT